jgi:hypothetical protein
MVRRPNAAPSSAANAANAAAVTSVILKQQSGARQALRQRRREGVAPAAGCGLRRLGEYETTDPLEHDPKLQN